MIVKFAPIVPDDFDAIAEHLKQQDVGRPECILSRLHAACMSLADMPERFSLVPGYEDLGVRRRVVGSHLVFYRVRAETLVILRILHGAQDYEAVLFGRH